MTELPSPAALIKTAAEPKTVARTSAHAQHKSHERREEGAATAFSVSKIRKRTVKMPLFQQQDCGSQAVVHGPFSDASLC